MECGPGSPGCAGRRSSRIQGGVAQEFKYRAVNRRRSRLGNDLSNSCGAVADLRRHYARERADFLDRVDIEIGERRPAHLRIGRVDTVHGKDCRRAALAVDGKLLREVGGAVGIRHGARSQQQQLAEVALVKWQFRDFLARELFAATGAHFACRTAGRCRLILCLLASVRISGLLHLSAGRSCSKGREHRQGSGHDAYLKLPTQHTSLYFLVSGLQGSFFPSRRWVRSASPPGHRIMQIPGSSRPVDCLPP